MMADSVRVRRFESVVENIRGHNLKMNGYSLGRLLFIAGLYAETGLVKADVEFRGIHVDFECVSASCSDPSIV